MLNDLIIFLTFRATRTLITRGYRGEESKVEIISGTDIVTAIEIHDPLMVGQVGYDLRMMQLIEKHNLSYILKSTNANSITMVFWEKDITKALIKELEKTYFEVTVKKVAIVCTLGTNIAKPGSLASATQALHENSVNIEAVSQSLKQVNMQFVIDRKDYKKAIIALNKALCC